MAIPTYVRIAKSTDNIFLTDEQYEATRKNLVALLAQPKVPIEGELCL